MKTRFTAKALIIGMVGAHVVSNLVIILFSWLLAGYMHYKSCKLFGTAVIYFLVTYELLFNCLKYFSVLADLNEKSVM